MMSVFRLLTLLVLSNQASAFSLIRSPSLALPRALAVSPSSASAVSVRRVRNGSRFSMGANGEVVTQLWSLLKQDPATIIAAVGAATGAFVNLERKMKENSEKIERTIEKIERTMKENSEKIERKIDDYRTWSVTYRDVALLGCGAAILFAYTRAEAILHTMP
jgi:predicted ATP-grasp superfamily ATP-dependent carboligase